MAGPGLAIGKRYSKCGESPKSAHRLTHVAGTLPRRYRKGQLTTFREFGTSALTANHQELRQRLLPAVDKAAVHKSTAIRLPYSTSRRGTVDGAGPSDLNLAYVLGDHLKHIRSLRRGE